MSAYQFLSRQVEQIEARAKSETVPVVVAKHDLPKGSLLTSATVAVRNIPRDFSHSVAVSPEQFGQLEGQALAFPVKAGEMVIWGLIEGKKTPSFSARVENGRRALTVPVDEINSISGMLEPGDMIDLIVTVDHKSEKITMPLMQSIQVMATGQRSVDDPKSGERRSYSTVTLDTTPGQAQNIIVAREAGKLTALLRNPQDKNTDPVSDADLGALLRGSHPAYPGGGRDVPVLYGGSIGKLPSEALNLNPVSARAPARQPGVPKRTERAAGRDADRGGTPIAASQGQD